MTSTVTAAVVGGTAGVITSLGSVWLKGVVDARFARKKHDLDYEYAERRKLREAIGRHHGRVLDAADSWNGRMRNLYDHEGKGWLSVGSNYGADNHYFESTVCRFLTLMARVRLFERDALFIDGRFADTSDLAFLRYMRALRMFMTDARVSEDVPGGQEFSARDHFFADQLRRLADAIIDGDDVVPAAELFERMKAGKLDPVCAFFDGLRRDEDRVRWDRIVAHHLVVMAFVNSFGDEVQRRDDYGRVIQELRHVRTAANVAALVSNLRLERDASANDLVATLQSRRVS
jgi:hypothetical protein